MKNFLFLICLTIVLSNKVFYAQCDSEEFEAKLDSGATWEKMLAVEGIRVCHLSQFIPLINEMFTVEVDVIFRYSLLKTLDILGDTNIVSLTHQYINEINNYDYDFDPELKIDHKLYATIILFKHGDYSTADILFEYLNSTNDIAVKSVLMLDEIIENLPLRETEAKLALINTLGSINSTSRFRAVIVLADRYGSEVEDLVAERFINDDDFAVRSISFDKLFKLNYPDLHFLLLTQLSLDEDGLIRLYIADSLLNVWGEPWDLKRVKDYQPFEQDTLKSTVGNYPYADLINDMIQEFIPPKPDSSITPLQMTNNLLAYTDSVYAYNWISSDTLYNDYRQRLLDIEEYISGDSISAAITEIDNMLSKVEQDYSEAVYINREAYLFLHYHLVYIKERLE